MLMFFCFQVTNYDNATGLPLIQLWSMMGDEVCWHTFFSIVQVYGCADSFLDKELGVSC